MIYYQTLCLKIAGLVANSVDLDEMPHSAASHQGLHCLLRPVCPNIYGNYGIQTERPEQTVDPYETLQNSV